MNTIDLFTGFAINLIVALVIGGWICARPARTRTTSSPSCAFNTIIYFVMAFLTFGAECGRRLRPLRYHLLGVALPHRHHVHPRDDLPVRDDALPVINSVLMRDGAWTARRGSTRRWRAYSTSSSAVGIPLRTLSRSIRYERIELITPENLLLLEDLRQRLPVCP
ncbi:MAG: hypothetical protein R2856_32460 [Caldilineaceae bacterium]